MENKRKIEIIGAVVLLILLLGIIGWVLWKQSPTTPSPTSNPNGNLPGQSATPTPGGASTVSSTPDLSEAAPTTVGKLFLERVGSYSSEANFENVTDVIPLTTDSYGAELLAAAKRSASQAGEGDGYFGVSVKVLSTKLVSSSDTIATVEALVQKADSVGSSQNTEVSYRTAKITLTKTTDGWKVSGYAWK